MSNAHSPDDVPLDATGVAVGAGVGVEDAVSAGVVAAVVAGAAGLGAVLVGSGAAGGVVVTAVLVGFGELVVGGVVSGRGVRVRDGVVVVGSGLGVRVNGVRDAVLDTVGRALASGRPPDPPPHAGSPTAIAASTSAAGTRRWCSQVLDTGASGLVVRACRGVRSCRIAPAGRTRLVPFDPVVLGAQPGRVSCPRPDTAVDGTRRHACRAGRGCPPRPPRSPRSAWSSSSSPRAGWRCGC